MPKENDRVVLLHDLPNLGLQARDVGTIVRVLDERAGYEVEFQTLTGARVARVTLVSTQFRPVESRDMLHVRRLSEI